MLRWVALGFRGFRGGFALIFGFLVLGFVGCVLGFACFWGGFDLDLGLGLGCLGWVFCLFGFSACMVFC